MRYAVRATTAVAAGWALAATMLPMAHANSTAVSAVKIAWADAAHTKVRISWSETGQLANTLSYHRTADHDLGSTAAAGANELVVPTSAFDDPDREWGTNETVVKIKVTDSAGGEALSVGFDTYTPEPWYPQFRFGVSGSVLASWPGRSDWDTDATPNDPLDLRGSTVFTPVLSFGDGGETCREVRLAPTRERVTTVFRQAQPYLFSIESRNEWGDNSGLPGAVGSTTGLIIGAPAVSAHGTTAVISGSVSQRWIYTSANPPVCITNTLGSGDHPMVLQARKNSSSPWVNVRSGKSFWSGKNAYYRFSVTTPGSRQYRVVALSHGDGDPNQDGSYPGLQYGAVSPTRTVVATTRVLGAKFLDPTVAKGKKATAFLAVSPPGSQRTLLQQFGSGSWRAMKSVTLSRGRGSYTFTTVRRGTTSYRFVVPATSWAGYYVRGAVSRTFTLSVR